MSQPLRPFATLIRRVQELSKSVYVRDVGVLAGGTGLAQALMVLTLPILTRLYAPGDFSVLAVYAAILGMISVAACLRLDVAIPLPIHDEDAANLLVLALLGSITVAGTVGLIVILFPNQIVGLIDQPKLKPFLWLLPLGIWMASSYSALQYWATRKRRFPSIAKTRLTQASGGIATQVGLGWIGIAPTGLLFGHMISSGAGTLVLGCAALRDDRAVLSSINLNAMLGVLRDYDRFPKYSTFEALTNSGGIQLPLLIIAVIAAGPEAGFLLLAMRTMQAPMSLIGSAVAQAFYSRAPNEYRHGKLDELAIDTLAGLSKVGIGPILFAGILAPTVFPWIFGDEWVRAGELVRWMTPWFVLQFLSSPVSMAMHVVRRQRELLFITSCGLILRVGAVCLSMLYFEQRLPEACAIGSAMYYFLLGVMVYMRTGCSILQVLNALKRGLMPSLVWVLLGATIVIGADLSSF